jgi:uncharacterized phosphosugar-binding protein
MSGALYLDKAEALLEQLRTTQVDAIQAAGRLMADSVEAGGLINLFGSGHSIIPVMDVFPRYGSYPVFRPLIDSRLSWFTVLGSGGVTELLWLERQEGYVANFLSNYALRPQDIMVVYSHGGVNAAGIEVAARSQELGLSVVAVTSVANAALNPPRHSSGKRLSDFADVVIDNCVAPIDALVPIAGWPAPVAAGSTLTAVAISMALVAELAQQLSERGRVEPVFVSPNIREVPEDNNPQVFEAYRRATCR